MHSFKIMETYCSCLVAGKKYLVDWHFIFIAYSQVTEWFEVSERFLSTVDSLQNLVKKLKELPNQAFGYYFYPYLWDMLGVLQTCAGFVRWLGKD